MSTLGGLCLGVALGFLLGAPAIEDPRAGQLRAVVILAFALAGVALL